ncbi:MAG: hypothetical protein KIS76_08290 [Pyrinomonadaceae bacterium]|nr:hypothetical protein [Pyrinomonadaceae bacterium]
MNINLNKNTFVKWVLPYSMILLSILRFLPIPIVPQSWHKFLSWGLFLEGFGLLVLIFLYFLRLFKNLSYKKNYLISILVFIALLFFHPFLQSICIHYVIWINKGNEANELINPVLGMELRKKFNSSGDIQYAEFIYYKNPINIVSGSNGGYISYIALIYNENHGLNNSMKRDELDSAYK